MEADVSATEDLNPSDAQEVEDEEHVIDIDPEREVFPVSYDITSYGADYPVDGLVKRLDQGDIVIPSFDPAYEETDEVRGFQRRFVWSCPQMDKFIELLLLGLPVPGVFLVRERSNRLLVLDGQQRLRTLRSFYKGLYNDRTYRLQYVQEPFAGKTYAELDDEDRRRLDDSIIHATVLRQEFPADLQDAVYSIFERLNTGGTALQPQEIRVALNSGPFLHAISDLNADSHWRALYGPASQRFKDQELILRVLALFEESDDYKRPVKGFLNEYLARNRSRTEQDAASLMTIFRTASATIDEQIGAEAFRPVRSLNAAVLDSIMVGMMRRVAEGPIVDPSGVRPAYEELNKNRDYRAATTSSTAAEDTVAERLTLATKAFADLR